MESAARTAVAGPMTGGISRTAITLGSPPSPAGSTHAKHRLALGCPASQKISTWPCHRSGTDSSTLTVLRWVALHLCNVSIAACNRVMYSALVSTNNPVSFARSFDDLLKNAPLKGKIAAVPKTVIEFFYCRPMKRSHATKPACTRLNVSLD